MSLSLGLLVLVASTATARDPVAELSALIAQQPSNGDLLLRRSSLNRDRGDFESALADLELAATIPETATLAHLRSGVLLFDLKRYAPALDSLDEVLARQPGEATARRLKAAALWHLGKRREATVLFQAAMNDDGEADPKPYLTYATLLAEATPPLLAEAVQVLDRGIQRLGPVSTLGELAADLEIRRRRWNGAIKYLDAVTASVPRKDYWLRRRGAVLELAGRPCEAIAAYRSALAAIASLPIDVQRTLTFENAKSELTGLVTRTACSRAQRR